MKVLVTGGAGFIGSHVVEEYVKNGNEVVVVDDLSMGSRNNLPSSDKVTFYERSITEYDFMNRLLIENDFDLIFLLAAIASVADTIDRPFESHQVNQEANVRILETIRTNGLSPRRVIFASSAAVYGTLPDLPKTEVGPVQPATAYAIDKYASERFVLAYSTLYNIPAVAVRFFNVFGPRQNPASPYSGVLSIISSALKNNTQFKLFGDGQQTRDFVYVKDVVKALKLASQNDDMVGNVYNVATGTSRTLLEAIQAFEDAADRDLNIKTQEERIGDIKYSSADISALRNVGYQPSYTFEEGVKLYWESL